MHAPHCTVLYKISWLWRLKSDATGSIPAGWVRGVTWVPIFLYSSILTSEKEGGVGKRRGRGGAEGEEEEVEEREQGRRRLKGGVGRRGRGGRGGREGAGKEEIERGSGEERERRKRWKRGSREGGD